MQQPAVPLASAIRALRHEILTAAAVGEKEPLRFQMESIELNVQAAVTNEGNGKVGWWIFQAGGHHEKTTTQNLTIRIVPLWTKADGSVTTDFSIASEVGPDFDPKVGPKDD